MRFHHFEYSFIIHRHLTFVIGRKPSIRLPAKLFEYVIRSKLSKYLCTLIGVGELLILRLACICTCDCFGRKVSGLLTVPT